MQNRIAKFIVFLSLSLAGISQASEESKSVETRMRLYSMRIVQVAHRQGIDWNDPQKMRKLFLASNAGFHITGYLAREAVRAAGAKGDHQTAYYEAGRSAWNHLNKANWHAACEAITGVAWQGAFSYATQVVNEAAEKALKGGGVAEAHKVAQNLMLDWLIENAETELLRSYRNIKEVSDHYPFGSSWIYQEFQTTLLATLSPEARMYLSWQNIFRELLADFSYLDLTQRFYEEARASHSV